MSDTRARGQDRLENWGKWSRLDSAPNDLKRQVNWYTPPVAGEVWDGLDADAITPPDNQDAERVEAMVCKLGYVRKEAVKLRYIERWRYDRLARRLRETKDEVEKMIIEIEKMVGRGI